MLSLLHFAPITTRIDFLYFMSRAEEESEDDSWYLLPQEMSFAMYLLELSFLAFDLNYLPASTVAAAAIHLTFQVSAILLGV